MKKNVYESQKLVSEYLQFHYLDPQDLLNQRGLVKIQKAFPVLCAELCRKYLKNKKGSFLRALDLGCATGRSTFELSRFCDEVLGIDYSSSFIAAAKHLKIKKRLSVNQIVEGKIGRKVIVKIPKGSRSDRVRFQQGDAHHLPSNLGRFDLIIMANLIDRLHDPKKCLKNISKFLNKGGILLITSPYTWLKEFTPEKKWLGGKSLSTRKSLEKQLGKYFKLLHVEDLPFLIREHRRKFQLGISEATVWRRR